MQHKPVMLTEALEQLAIKDDGIYLDGTFGRGGHSRAILNSLGANGRLLAVDRDVEAINSAIAQELKSDKRFTLSHCCFSALETILAEEALLGQVDGILLDLGVSSPQLDNPERGFSFMQDGPLDMRMNASVDQTAADWLSNVDEKELARVLYEYGEERFSRRIAKAIVSARAISPLTMTGQLAKLIEQAQPIREKHKHPATRSFQAIRIEVNKELDELTTLLQQSMAMLKKGGRLVVISFHSLEDRLVKQFIRAESGAKYDPGKLPIKQADIAKGSLIKVGRPIKASSEEVKENPRSRSAVMRVAERV